jgi:hypothetical protein
MYQAVERAVQVGSSFFPNQMIEAQKSLDHLLQSSLNAKDQRRAWGFSYLAKGFPVEFVFTSKQKEIRYTVDPAGPNKHPQDILHYSLELLKEIDDSTISESCISFFEGLQKSGGLKYGCWVGGRHTALGNEFKLYVEVPQGSDNQAIQWLHSYTPFQVDFYERPISQDCRIKLDIIGYSPKSEQLEYYFSITGLAAWEIGALLTPAGFEAEREPLMELLQEAYGSPIYREFPSSKMGFSYSFSPHNNTSVFSLYTFASSMFGGDARVRQGILSLCRKRGWNMDYYAQLSQPLADAKGSKCTHGMFGIALSKNNEPVIYLGLRPPETNANSI